ncbi:MAG TPA: hypothetical protein VLV88_03575 [Terriglobales bacterium]|nr:hypothetical protein [Terriglobales bacterium]
MPTDPKRVHLQLDADPRFAAGAGGAVRYMAENAGLEASDASQFQAAAIDACETAFSNMTAEHRHLDVFLTQFEDRIEVAFSQEGDAAPAVSLRTIMEGPVNAVRGVDRVQYEHEGGASITRLTKYLSPHS